MKKINNLAPFLVLFLLSSCLASIFGPSTRRKSSQYNYNAQSTGMPSVVKKRVAILPFFNESPYGGEDLAFHSSEYFRSELHRVPDYVVDNSGNANFGTSKEIYAAGGSKLNQLVRSAKSHGVNLVIYGRITEARVRQRTDEIGFVRKTVSYAESNLEIRVFDVHSNKEIYVGKQNGNINDSSMKFFMSDREANLTYRQELLRYSLRVAIKRFIPNMINLGAKLDWTGRVARIVGNKIYINAGRQSGLQIGDILKVMTEAQDIYDPETGAFIGVSKGEIKATVEVVDYFGGDGAIGVLHSGGTVTEGDFVQLY